jgi:hypothetical protein
MSVTVGGVVNSVGALIATRAYSRTVRYESIPTSASCRSAVRTVQVAWLRATKQRIYPASWRSAVHQERWPARLVAAGPAVSLVWLASPNAAEGCLASLHGGLAPSVAVTNSALPRRQFSTQCCHGLTSIRPYSPFFAGEVSRT